MSDDLVSLRVLVFGLTGAERDLLRQGAALASLPLEFEEASSAGRAAAFLERGNIDLVLLDALSSEADQASVIKAARAAARQPFTILVGGDKQAVGPDAVVKLPGSEEEARQALDSCVCAKLPCRALIVDDSKTMRGIVRKILGGSRFAMTITEVDNGAAALANVRSGGIDVVFLDYNMPGLDGLATLAELKRAAASVTVILMTSTQDEAVAVRALSAGAAAFLKKPFFPADVDAVLYRRCGLTPLRRTS